MGEPRRTGAATERRLAFLEARVAELEARWASDVVRMLTGLSERLGPARREAAPEAAPPPEAAQMLHMRERGEAREQLVPAFSPRYRGT